MHYAGHSGAKAKSKKLDSTPQAYREKRIGEIISVVVLMFLRESRSLALIQYLKLVESYHILLNGS